ncbi:MAG: nicotinamide-nucleotide amidohydrolase family protein [Clostridia bacterium]|nr:nicotinamide-nucleotide amidohydrolase family protein [Clostridia bacterium]
MKNCLTVIHNKKTGLADTDAQPIASYFSSHGLYFDRVQYVGYDSGDEITKSLTDMKTGYSNGVVVCPSSLMGRVEQYLEKLYGQKFTEGHAMHLGNGSVFVTDEHFNVNTPENICRVISQRFRIDYRTSYVKTVGAGMKEIEDALKSAEAPNILFRVHGQYGEDTVEILYNDSAPKSQVDDVIRKVNEGLKSHVYALEDIGLAAQLYNLLKLRRMKISVAESFTGGGICRRLVEVPGVSEVFVEGINSYANISKVKRLGVKDETLRRYGAVSAQTAKEMAEGLVAWGDCDIALSTTGIAGPKSDGTNKPVGLCYIGVATKEKTETYEYRLTGDRKTITETAINSALFLAYLALK